MADHPCLLLVPMQYGRSKRQLTAEGMTSILAALNRQFGGCTPIGRTESPPGVTPGGQWVDPDTGEVDYDVCWLVKVAVPPDKLDQFRKVAKAIGWALEQKAVYIEIGPPSVEILSIEDEPPDRGQLSLFDIRSLLDDGKDENTQSAATG